MTHDRKLRLIAKKPRYMIIPAVFLVLLKGNKVLLQRRRNTGHEDGHYSLVGGHFEGNESATSVLIREAKEEAGISVQPADLKLVYVLHKNTDEERIDLFFSTKKWKGTPHICEQDKCDDLRFVSVYALPSNTIKYIAQALRDMNRGVIYGEFGW